jgi:hypothetical protein
VIRWTRRGAFGRARSALRVRPAFGSRLGDGRIDLKRRRSLAFSALKNSGWADAIAPGAELEVQVREPATWQRLTVQEIRRCCDGVALSPDETLTQRRLKQLLA